MASATMGLCDAKSRLSELVARAERGEPTSITRHGQPVAKIVAMNDEPPFDAEHSPKTLEAMQQLGREIAERHGAWNGDEIGDRVR